MKAFNYMKVVNTFLLLLSTPSGSVHAQNSTALLEAAIKELPKCALNCMLADVSKSSCELSDFYCIAHNQQLNDQMTACVQANCTIREALTAKNFTVTAYGLPVRDQTRLVSYNGMIGGGFALAAIIIRIFARIPCFGGTWGLDDWAIVFAMVPIIPLTALSILLANYGLGKDIWTVPFDNITKILHIYYFDELFYLSAIALTKISILLFYLRIFPNPNFRRLVYGTLTLCVLYIVGFVVATAVQCIPVRIAWEHWDGEHHGKCINLNLEGWMSAALNIIFDIIVICLPLRELSKLAMSRRKKAGIMLMFLGGGFVTVVSILRLKWMIQFANSQNVTWDYTPIGYWSTLEVHVGIVIACLPALRSLQHRVFPDSRSPNSYYHRHSGAYVYDYDSKGRSPLPSLAKYRKGHSDISQASQASMMRSRDRTKHDKEFIQLDEYEYRIGDEINPMEGEEYFRGLNHTQVERGSVHTDDAVLLPIQGTNGSPTARQDRRSLINEKSAHGTSPQVITVRKDYSVTIEISPDQLSSSPPRMSEEEQGRREKGSFDQNRRQSRDSSRRRIAG